MPIQWRNRSPEGSSNGNPLAWTRAPGAWPAIRMRALGERRTTGRGACAVAVAPKRSAQSRQEEIRVSRSSAEMSIGIRYRGRLPWQSALVT